MRALRTVVLLLIALAAGTVLWLDLTDLSRSAGSVALVAPPEPTAPAKPPADKPPPEKPADKPATGAPPPAPIRSTVAAPDPALLEQGPYGPLPRIGARRRSTPHPMTARSTSRASRSS